MQCPSCGRRFREPHCPAHGPLAALSAAPDPATWPTIEGYRLLKVLGSGGFGRAHLAEGDEGQVAIKTAHRSQPLADERLRREAAALRAVGPPYVPRLHAAGELADRTPYIVMELITWPTLADVLADRAPLGVDEALRIGRAILIALGAAHGHKLVHRALKPQNIFVGEHDAKLAR